MKCLKNLKIGSKIVFSFVAVIVLVAIMLVVTQVSMRGIFSYKGRAAAVLSLQAVCGCGTGAGETVCVVLRIDELMIALTADSAESLIADSGQRLQADGSLTDGKLLSLDCVLPGEPAVFVINLKNTYQKIESDFNAAAFI